MANYSSEAYDLSLFEPKSAKITPLPGKKATKAERRQEKLQKLLNTAATTLVACCVVLILALMISSQVQLTEMNSAISQTETRLNEAIGEVKRLESELASQTSAQSVEEYAESVGLRQMESGQIDYITVTPAQPAEAENASFWGSLWETLTGWLR